MQPAAKGQSSTRLSWRARKPGRATGPGDMVLVNQLLCMIRPVRPDSNMQELCGLAKMVIMSTKHCPPNPCSLGKTGQAATCSNTECGSASLQGNRRLPYQIFSSHIKFMNKHVKCRRAAEMWLSFTGQILWSPA